MSKISIQELKIDSIIQSTEYLDNDFIIFLPETIFSAKIKSILTKQSIQSLNIDQSEVENLTTANEEIVDTALDMSKYPSITYDDLQYFSNYKKFEKQYTMLYYDLKNIVSSITTTYSIEYKDIGDLIYNKVYPLIQENPSIFLAIAEFNVSENSKFCELINFLLQNLLFAASLLENDKNKIITTLEDRIQVCLVTCLSNIGLISVLEKTHKKEIIQLFYHKKLNELIPKLSYKILKDSLFPSAILLGVRDSRTQYYHSINSTSQINAKQLKISEFGKFSFIVNFYIYLLSLRQDKFSIPMVILQSIGERSSKQFDPVYVRMILKILGKLAPGTYVELQNNEIGMILTAKSHDTEFPLLHLLKNTQKQLLHTERIVRINTENRSIKRLLSIDEINEARRLRKQLLKVS